MSEQNELKPSNLATWPERIYLQHGDGNVPIYDECTEVTWCQHATDSNDVEYVRADLADERKTDEQRVKQDNLEGMAASMDMFREDMIEAGIIDDNVPPMFMTEAILGYIGKLRAGNLTAEHVRAVALEEAARLVENGQETITAVGEAEQNVRYVGPRKHGNLMGIAYADAIRALMGKEGKS